MAPGGVVSWVEVRAVISNATPMPARARATPARTAKVSDGVGSRMKNTAIELINMLRYMIVIATAIVAQTAA
jgi:hypothetical protein